MVEKATADILAKQSIAEIEAGFKWKKKRMQAIDKYEEAYMNVTPEALPGRFSVCMPVLSGFTDALVAGLTDGININFDKAEEADLEKSRKVTAMWKRDSGPTKGKWRIKDLHGKKQAALSGVAIFHYTAEGSEDGVKYKSNLRLVPRKLFYCQPRKGNDLEEHAFMGEANYFRTFTELERAAKNGTYDKEQVAKLKDALESSESTRNEALTEDNDFKYKAMGLGTEDNKVKVVGETTCPLFSHRTTYLGTRYYVLIDYSTGIWVRIEKLEDMFSIPSDSIRPLWDFKAWHTNPDPENFWSKGPADDVWPIHEQIRLTISYAFENLKKRMRPKTAVDSELFPDISEIMDDVTEVVETNALAAGKRVGDGVFRFTTEDNTQIIVYLANFLNSFLGEQTGVTPGAKGNSSEDKATIYVGNMQEVSKRMSLYSEFYRQCWAELGMQYFIGLKDHLTSGIAVKYLGATGIKWGEITKEDLQPIQDFDIVISGRMEDSEMATQKNQQRRDSLIMALREFKQFMNPMKSVESLLRAGGWEEDEIKQFQDMDIYSDQSVLAEAAEAIQMIITGKMDKLKPNRRANAAFVLKLLDYADDNKENLEPEEFEYLYSYAQMHLKIVAENSARRAMMIASMSLMPQGPMGGGAAPMPESPTAPGIPNGGASLIQ